MEYNRENCKEHQFQLLNLLRSPVLGSYYIRALEDTAQCDQHYNHLIFRNKIKAKLGRETTNRILNFSCTPTDELRVINLIALNQKQYREEIWKGLGPIQKLQYTLQKMITSLSS